MSRSPDLLSELQACVAEGEFERASSLLSVLAAGSRDQQTRLLRVIPDLVACAEALRDETRSEILQRRRGNAAYGAYRSIAQG